MNHFVSGIIKIVLLEAFVALILIDRVAGDAFPRARRAAFAITSLAMLGAWAGYGRLRGDASVAYVASGLVLVLVSAWLVAGSRPAGATIGPERAVRALRNRRWLAPAISAVLLSCWVSIGVGRGAIPLVHPAEQLHFYLGAKYQREVGWFDLYPAVLAADRETLNVLAFAPQVRDVRTFEVVPLARAAPAIRQAKQRFSSEQWDAFKSDWTRAVGVWPQDWHGVILDHGNSSSPAWALLAHPLARLVPLTPAGVSLLGWIDMALLYAAWLFVLATFGGRRASAALVLFAAAPIVFEFTAGSLLRWDWVFASAMAICFLRRDRPATAGAFFGYAVMTKLFPACFGLALVLHLGWEYARTRRVPSAAARFFVAAALSALAIVALSSVVFGPGAWTEYLARIKVAHDEKFYAIQYSLRTVFLQLAVPLSRGSVNLNHLFLFPTTLDQAQPGVSIDDHAASFLVVRLLFTALFALLVRRARAWEAFALGPLLVLIWLTVNMYYWCMLGFCALGLLGRRDGPATGLLLALHGALMFFYVHQHLARPLTEGYVVAWLVLASILAMGGWELKLWLAAREDDRRGRGA
jgi:hypothetical protein